jgi:hypothetical protein
MSNDDPRYDFATCMGCGKEWQNIDRGCALHVFFCDAAMKQTNQWIMPRRFGENKEISNV